MELIVFIVGLRSSSFAVVYVLLFAVFWTELRRTPRSTRVDRSREMASEDVRREQTKAAACGQAR